MASSLSTGTISCPKASTAGPKALNVGLEAVSSPSGAIRFPAIPLLVLVPKLVPDKGIGRY